MTTGLTSRQQWTAEHIDRCPTCGAWEVITDRELHSRQLGTNTTPAFCKHFTHHESEAA